MSKLLTKKCHIIADWELLHNLNKEGFPDHWRGPDEDVLKCLKNITKIQKGETVPHFSMLVPNSGGQ